MAKYKVIKLSLAILALSTSAPVLAPVSFGPAFESAPAAAAEQSANCLAEKNISDLGLDKCKQTKVAVKEENKKINYSGVPLRLLLPAMVPDVKLETMPEWKALSRREIVMEVVGNDGYPGLVTAIEIAINKDGDNFVLATHKDGRAIEGGPQLICKMDPARTRCVRYVKSVRVISLSPKQ